MEKLQSIEDLYNRLFEIKITYDNYRNNNSKVKVKNGISYIVPADKWMYREFLIDKIINSVYN